MKKRSCDRSKTPLESRLCMFCFSFIGLDIKISCTRAIIVVLQKFYFYLIYKFDYHVLIWLDEQTLKFETTIHTH